MNQNIINEIEKEYMKDNVAEFEVGDTVKVDLLVKEGNRERIQVFEGIVIKKQNGGVRETFTVRKISYGVGVEKTLPIHSPKVSNIKVVKRGHARRAKLNYLRGRTGRASKLRDRKRV